MLGFATERQFVDAAGRVGLLLGAMGVLISVAVVARGLAHGGVWAVCTGLTLAISTGIGIFVGTWALMLPGIVSVLATVWLLRPGKLSRVGEANLIGWFMVMPAALLLIVWHFAPAIYAFVLSFLENFNFVGQAKFAGLDNYRALFEDGKFWRSLLNSAWYVIGTVPVGIAIATVIAVLLNEKVRFQGLFRTIFFLPYITALTAAAAVWKWIYHPEFGVLNAVLHTPGQEWLTNPTGVITLMLKPLSITPPEVLAGPSVALVAIIVMSIWHHLGYSVVILLAGVQSIPREYYEAASLDGANWWDQFRLITWPLLSPTTFFLSITGLISAFQVFTQILVLTPDGGLLGDTTTIVLYLFRKGFRDHNFSYASAMAFVLFALVFIGTLIQGRLLAKRVTYEI